MTETRKIRALGAVEAGLVRWGYPLELPEGAVALRVYGTGLPKGGVEITAEDIETGVVGVTVEENTNRPIYGGRSLM